MLAAKARGLDTCPQIFLTKYHAVVRRHLPIDDSQIMLCGMSIGYADTSSTEYTINMPRIRLMNSPPSLGLNNRHVGYATPIAALWHKAGVRVHLV